MSLLRKVWDCTVTGVSHAWRALLDVGWAVWSEITDGARRLSWWALLGLVWLDGLALGWWLWVH
jgi:hypothetical protein